MNRTKLKIYIVPCNTDLKSINGYNESECGTIVSTLNEIKVNNVQNGYSIIYYSDDITKMDMEVLGNNIIKLFMKNITDKIVHIELYYLYESIDKYGDLDIEINIQAVKSLLTLESKFNKFNSINNHLPFIYNKSDNINKIISEVINNYKELDDEDEEDYYDEDDSDYFKSFGINNIIDDDDFQDEDDDSFSLLDKHIDGNKRKRKKIQESRIIHNAKNPKRSYNRHGVIITDKESKKEDEKIIKEFLKEFIPGNSEWKKNFRHDVLKRWMKMFCVTKKDLKELERTYRKARNTKKNNIKTEKTLDFTRRLFNVPIDRWNDPNR